MENVEAAKHPSNPYSYWVIQGYICENSAISGGRLVSCFVNALAKQNRAYQIPLPSLDFSVLEAMGSPNVRVRASTADKTAETNDQSARRRLGVQGAQLLVPPDKAESHPYVTVFVPLAALFPSIINYSQVILLKGGF